MNIEKGSQDYPPEQSSDYVPFSTGLNIAGIEDLSDQTAVVDVVQQDGQTTRFIIPRKSLWELGEEATEIPSSNK